MLVRCVFIALGILVKLDGLKQAPPVSASMIGSVRFVSVFGKKTLNVRDLSLCHVGSVCVYRAGYLVVKLNDLKQVAPVCASMIGSARFACLCFW